MLNRTRLFNGFFLAISALGALFVLAETVMQSIGKSICFSEGCKIAAQSVRYGEISILLVGLLMFLSLTALMALSLRYQKPFFERCINLIIIVSLACEGFFMGYLAFRLYAVCIFCVIVCSFLVILGILRLLSAQYEILAGFAALVSIFILFYLVLPVGTMVALPENERLVLFYSKDCKYCAEVIAALEKQKIPVRHLEANAYAGLLKGMGIDSVPTLVVNDRYQKVLLVGAEAIKRYLKTCEQEQMTATKPAKKRNQNKSNPSRELTIITPSNLFTGAAISQSSGVCKQDEICK